MAGVVGECSGDAYTDHGEKAEFDGEKEGERGECIAAAVE